jgi:hypothetical protein
MRPRPVRVILSDIHDAGSGLFEVVWYSKSGDRESSAMCVGPNVAEFRKHLRDVIEQRGIPCLMASGEAPFPKARDEYEKSKVVAFQEAITQDDSKGLSASSVRCCGGKIGRVRPSET